MKIEKLVPPAVFAVAIAAALSSLIPHGKVRGFDLEAFGRIPILEGGRVKPIDSVARNSLLMLNGHQSFTYEGRTVGADEWLLDVMFRREVADAQPVFQINDPDVLGLLNVPQTTNKYYPFTALAPHIDAIQSQAGAASAVDAKQRTRFQSAIANLFERVYLYYRLRNTAQLDAAPGGLSAMIEARTLPGVVERLQEFQQLAFFRPVPPPAGDAGENWRGIAQVLGKAGSDGEGVLQAWAHLGSAYAAQDGAGFDRAIAELSSGVAALRPDAERQAGHEIVFNRSQPFYQGMVIYVLALLVVFVSWIYKPRLLQPAAFALLAAGAVVHTAGLVSRIVLQGRPPVTNLYSSAVFVGWGAVILGVVLERIYRRGFGTAVAAAAGFSSLIIAHHLIGDGDTMEMMRAVLDSNFWLATHVTTITIGYSGTFLAGAIAVGYAIRRWVVPAPDAATTKSLVSMAYGVICFSLLFSFVGTVLGGIWADQSWGRFWGWDPKENGALLIVLWNAIILHTRWGGYAREKGIMAMAIFGTVVTSFSWWGVNMLGVGLHSYGFMDKAFWALAAFSGVMFLLMAMCLVPIPQWLARAPTAAAAQKRRQPARA